jgi:hypothetical protein
MINVQFFSNARRVTYLAFESLHNGTNALQKKEFISMAFDNNLYYQGGIFRAPAMKIFFAHNALIMNKKGLDLPDNFASNLKI